MNTLNPHQVARLVSAVVLDEAAAAQTIAAIGSSSSLANIAAECQRTMLLRGRELRELQPFLAENDPVMALTVEERLVLAMAVREKIELANIANALELSRAKAVAKILKTARRELARAAIAMALFGNPTKCQWLKAQRTESETLERRRALQLVEHAAACQNCVEVMRVVDKQILIDYANAVAVDLPVVSLTDEQLQARAAIEIKSIAKWRKLNWPKFAVVAGAISTALILLAVLKGA